LIILSLCLCYCISSLIWREVKFLLLQYVCSWFCSFVHGDGCIFIVNYVLCMGTSMKWYLNKCRVTCRDWFQLSLKEGLTVFRDQVQVSSFQYSKWQLYNHNFICENVSILLGVFIWHGEPHC
jgi:hypothetical protein